MNQTASQYLAYIPAMNINWNILQNIKIISAFPFESDQITSLIFLFRRVLNHSCDETYLFTNCDSVLRNNCAKIGVYRSFHLIYKRISFCSHQTCLFRGFDKRDQPIYLRMNLILGTLLLRVYPEYYSETFVFHCFLSKLLILYCFTQTECFTVHKGTINTKNKRKQII